MGRPVGLCGRHGSQVAAKPYLDSALSGFLYQKFTIIIQAKFTSVLDPAPVSTHVLES